jgi:LysM repeat protein
LLTDIIQRRMQKWIMASLLLTIGVTKATAQSYEERVRAYIERFKTLAVEEQLRSGIPASITLAQGIHETSAGASELATNANNHFGIKCKKSWTGETYAYTDDAPDECFRKYGSAEQSYKDHSDYLAKTPRYATLFTYSKTDYAAWAKGLKQAGYATNPRYAQVLIKLIEDYRLQEYTYAAMDNNMGGNVAIQKEVVPEHDPNPAVSASLDVPVAAVQPTIQTTPISPSRKSRIVVNEVSDDSPADAAITYPPYGEPVRVNGLKAVYARKGDMPLEYALKTNIRYEKLLEINDISDKPLPADMYLYLEKKHTKGIRPIHTVKEGETIAKVSQYEGVQAKSIRTLNKLGINDEPAPGTILYLQQEAENKPQTIASTEPVSAPTVPVPEPIAEPTAATPPAVETVSSQPASTEGENTLGAANVPEQINAVATVPVPEPPVVSPNAEEPAQEPVTAVIKEPATVPVPEPTSTETVAATMPAEPVNKEIGPATPPEVVTHTATEPVATAPNPPVNIANEKPIEEILKEEKKAATTTPAAEEPKDELDALKARFDKVVYARKSVAVDTAAPKTEVKKEEPAVTAVPAPEVPINKEPVAAVNYGPKFHVVKKGDTAFSIAQKYSISMRQLMDWNKLNFEAIKVGQRLRIQQP